MKKELKLKEFLGQRHDVVLFERNDGSKYITFKSDPGYGAPSCELDKLKELLGMLEKL